MDCIEMARELIVRTLADRKIPDSVCLKECGINPVFLSDWKTGKSKSPSFDKVYRIFRYLGLSLDDLDGEKEGMALDMGTVDLLDRVRDAALKAIDEKGTTKAECARACGIAPTFFTEWENGKIKSPGFDKVFKIYQYLGLSLDTLSSSDHSVDEIPQAEPPIRLAADESEILRLYQMQDMEGRTEILHAAYEQKKRLAKEAMGATRGERMAEEAKSIIDGDQESKEG